MILTSKLTFWQFWAGWLPSAALAAKADPVPALSDAFLVPLFGVPVPAFTCLLGVLGILLARPFAVRREAAHGWPSFALVTTIMLIVVELWIIESRPGWLFAFVIAIGLGFSGYSLIELVGGELRAFITRIITTATGTIGRGGKNQGNPDA